MYTNHWRLLTHELCDPPEPLTRLVQSIQVFAEGETQESFSNIHMLVAIELGVMRNEYRLDERTLTSLTGIDETLSSCAKNHPALRNMR